ncbi:MAG TPA: penicillin acylase family protein [Streptosporangiaceae bacterium]
MAGHGVIKMRLAAVGGAVALAVTGVVPGALGVAAAAGTGPAAQGFTIVRSSYGVPTITATSQARMWFGAGWAQAQDRMVQLELTRRAVEGTLSAIFGPSQVSQDTTVRTLFYTPAELAAQFQSLPAATRMAITEFSDGINAYEASAYASPASEAQKVPYEFFVLGQALGLTGPYQPAAWQPGDTVAVGNFLARQFGGGGGSELTNLQFLQYLENELIKSGAKNPFGTAAAIFNDARWTNDRTAPTTVPRPSLAPSASASPAKADAALLHAAAGLPAISHAVLAKAAAKLSADRATILKTGAAMRVLSHGGSNAVAVAPWRSADHHALLWGAPQEGFGTPSVDGEEYLHAPGYDAGGMYITGEPFILIGRNANLAWTTTSEELVDQRIYIEHNVNYAANPPTYEFNGQQIPMQAIPETIDVAGQPSVNLTVLRTIDGPVVLADPADHLAISLRFASWNKETGTLAGFAQLGGDANLAQFRHSMSLVTTLHNFLYADRHGNIAYFGDGLVPIEPRGVDPRLPGAGDGTQQWTGFVPFAQMPHSINPRQGFLDNWNTKPSQQAFYQQNSGDEYWGTIFRSQLISQLAKASTSINIKYLEGIEHAIGTIDNGDNTRPAARYFIPYLVSAYQALVKAGDPIVSPATHPDLRPAIGALEHWNGVTTLGSPAMSIFMNFLEAYEHNVFEGGLNPGEQYTGKVNFSDGSLGLGTYGGLGGMATYNLLYHALNNTAGVLPCQTLCYQGGYFAGHRSQLLVESLNDAITILSGTGTQLGQNVPGFGTTDIAKWGFQPAQDQNWDSLDPLAVGITTHCGTSASQNRSTFMMAVDAGPTLTGQDELPPGQSAFISAAGTPSPHFCDQVGLFNDFRYKNMPPA